MCTMPPRPTVQPTHARQGCLGWDGFYIGIVDLSCRSLYPKRQKCHVRHLHLAIDLSAIVARGTGVRSAPLANKPAHSRRMKNGEVQEMSRLVLRYILFPSGSPPKSAIAIGAEYANPCISIAGNQFGAALVKNPVLMPPFSTQARITRIGQLRSPSEKVQQ